MAIGPERAIGTGPIGEGPIGPQPDAQGDVTFGWHQPFAGATRRAVVRGIVAALVWVPFVPPVTTTGWQQPLSTAVARPSVNHTQPTFVYGAVAEDNTVTIDKWQQPLGMSAVPIARAAPPGGSPFVPKEAVLENTVDQGWRVPLSTAVPARAVWHTTPFYGYPYEGVDNSRPEWDWYIQWKAPPRYWWKGRPYQPFVPKEATVENTTVKVRPLTQGQTARPIPRTAPLGYSVYGYPYVTEEEVVVEITVAFSHYSQIINRNRTIGY